VKLAVADVVAAVFGSSLCLDLLLKSHGSLDHLDLAKEVWDFR